MLIGTSPLVFRASKHLFLGTLVNQTSFYITIALLANLKQGLPRVLKMASKALVGHQFSGKLTPGICTAEHLVSITKAAAVHMKAEGRCYVAGVRLQTGRPARAVGQVILGLLLPTGRS